MERADRRIYVQRHPWIGPVRASARTIGVAVAVALALLLPSLGGIANASAPGSGSMAAHASGPAGSSCPFGTNSTNPIRVDQGDYPDTLDPAESFSSAGWAAIQQVYQGLVAYNGSSPSTFGGVLATNWTVVPTLPFESYVFHLRPGVKFSNGDPYNAYVQWYSLYRSLLMTNGVTFILEQNFFSTNFNASSPLSYYSPLATSNAANSTLALYLNSWNFFDPTAAEIALMETANQSFQVVNSLTLQLNLGYGYLASNYTYLLAALADPSSYAVDPAVVDANGGIQYEGSNAFPNAWMASHTLGTGPFVLTNFTDTASGGYTLTPSPQYWGELVSRFAPGYSLIQPANRSFDVVFTTSNAEEVSDLLNGTAATAAFGVNTYLNSTLLAALGSDPCLVTETLPTAFGATDGSWWIYVDVNQGPFDNLSVREAIAHAIDYSTIYRNAFGGRATYWVGPVPPGYPYYNPEGLGPYSYDLPLAEEEIANSPCAADACAGTNYSFEYVTTDPAWQIAADEIQTDLATIGITVHPVGLTLADLYELEFGYPGCVSTSGAFGGPFYLGLEFYSSDYFSPDDWTQEDAATTGVANQCMAQFSNATVDSEVETALATSNPTTLDSLYGEITSALYGNYSEIWLAVPTAYAAYSVNLEGLVQNPMGMAAGSALELNTVWVPGPAVTPPTPEYAVDFTESGLSPGTYWTVTLGGNSNASRTSEIGFSVENGTYAYTVGAVSGFTASPASGSIPVHGGASPTAVTFTPVLTTPSPKNGSSSPSTFLGLPPAEGAALLAGVLVVIAAAAVGAWRLLRRPRTPRNVAPDGPK